MNGVPPDSFGVQENVLTTIVVMLPFRFINLLSMFWSLGLPRHRSDCSLALFVRCYPFSDGGRIFPGRKTRKESEGKHYGRKLACHTPSGSDSGYRVAHVGESGKGLKMLSVLLCLLMTTRPKPVCLSVCLSRLHP